MVAKGEELGQAKSLAGGPGGGGPDFRGGRRKPLVQSPKPWPSAGADLSRLLAAWLMSPGHQVQLCWPWACSPLGWMDMEDVAAGVWAQGGGGRRCAGRL